MKGVSRRDFDMVLAWSVDRLGRSLTGLLELLSEPSTPSGKAMFQMMGVFAEFERSMIRERVLAGMSRAAAGGTRSGKPIGRPRLASETEAGIRAALEKGDIGMRKVAVQFGVATGTVQRIAKGLAASIPA